ncbi:MAG: tetratricopeptide repeat protein [Bacteroidia bacterium]|jgi:tetratricopeptide (TPR) repeat protein|nr:tetratricopeptide repeat protein [Bacteroidia bacterium]
MKRVSVVAAVVLFAFAAKAQTMSEGLQALDFEQFEKARNIFTTLSQQEPTNGTYFYYLGQAQWKLYKNDEAAKAYQAGKTAQPTNPMNFAGMGGLFLEENKVTEAKAEFDKALSFSKGKDGRVKDINALRVVAEAMVSADTKLVDEAIVLIEQALEIDKKNYDVLITAGDIYLEKNEAGKAASTYENAIALQKNNPKAYTRVSGIWLRVKNAEATKTDLDRALAIDPNYAPALKNLAEYYLQSKQYAKAKETFEKYLQNSEPSNANKARYARILFRSKDYAEALNIITDLQKTDKSDLYLFRLAGYSYYEVGNETKDTTKFQPGVDALTYFMANIDPKKIISSDYEYLGKLYARIKGKDSLAIVNIEQALATDPNKSELLKEAGMIYNKLKRFDQSVMYFEKYIGSTTKVQLVDYQLLGLAAYYGKQYPKSDSAFAKILELKPDYADGYYWRGAIAAGSDPEFKTPIAKDYWEKYLTLTEATPDKFKKNLITTYNNLGVYYIKNDNNAKAKEYYNKALGLDPENKTAKDMLKQIK